ncbi:MAG: rod shape-determining protein RodA [Candidatus Omnitrophica bacterium]|nr:rod shape-determining protein RodA [Candidatus Omnitrophota bacterium]
MRSSTFLILIIAIVISLIGILSIYSSTYQKEVSGWQLVYRRQILWVILGLILFFLMANFNYRRLWDASYLLYAVVVFLLLLVFVLGAIRLGAQRWLRFGWFNFQPSELAKIVTVIFLAKYFSKKSSGDVSLLMTKFGIVRAFILPFIFVAIPMGLIIEQPDLGSAIVVLLIFISMLYLAGIKLRYILILSVVALISLPVFWHFLRDYQKDRLMVFFNPNVDPLGAGYTVIQSKIAIGSGGFWGKGWLAGTQSQLHFLPESHTDFIFATFSEQWGLLGSTVLILLYCALIREGIRIGLATHDYFGRLLAFGVSLMLGLQIFINIAMNLGLAPVVGIPLPLMSYGGSSIFTTFISLGILANIDKKRSVF